MINGTNTLFYDKIFVKFCKEFDNIEDIYFNENSQPNLPLTTPFVQKKKDIDHSTLYSFNGPFERLHADIADLSF